MHNKLLLWSIYSLGLLFCTSCANISSPQGGPKDILPPVVIDSKPENGSTQISPHQIELTFNEYVVLSDVFNQVLVSPPLSEQPILRIKGKNLLISIQDTLKQDVTYTIYFGEAIKDLNENNKLLNYNYVFSTGAVLDTLEISGKIVNAEDLKFEEGVLVMLYPQTDDSIVYTQRPWYFAQTTEDGTFRISHIKEGMYKIFALKDQNFNYLYDLPNEQIAFQSDLVKVDSNSQFVDMQLFAEVPDSTSLLDSRFIRYGKVQFSFNRSASRDQISLLNQPGRTYYESSKYNDTLWLWYTDTGSDSLFYSFSTDSAVEKGSNTTLLDEGAIKLTALSKDSLLKNKKLGLQINLPDKPLSKGEESKLPVLFDLGKQLQIVLSNPILEVDTARIHLMEDSVIIRAEIQIEYREGLFRKITIANKLKSNMEYQLQIDSGALKDIYGLRNTAKSWFFKTRQIESYGTVGLNVSVKDSSSCILQVLDTQEKVLRQAFFRGGSNEVLKFKYMSPGKYKFRIIYDINNNGRWDTGNYSTKIQPEPVILYEQTADLRPNWDIEYEWIVDSLQ